MTIFWYWDSNSWSHRMAAVTYLPMPYPHDYSAPAQSRIRARGATAMKWGSSEAREHGLFWNDMEEAPYSLEWERQAETNMASHRVAWGCVMVGHVSVFTKQYNLCKY